MAAVVDGIAAGAVDAIATDHAPHAGSEKMQEFERCPFGIIGLETALALALETLVHTGQDSAGAPGGAVHHRARRAILRLDRGTLAPGAPGDVTIFSTELDWTYDVNQSFSKSRNTPFDGRRSAAARWPPSSTAIDRLAKRNGIRPRGREGEGRGGDTRVR